MYISCHCCPIQALLLAFVFFDFVIALAAFSTTKSINKMQKALIN